MAWIYLAAAGLLEIVWAIGLKSTHGFSGLWPSIGTIAAMIASLALLGLALRSLPLGTAYAIWTGTGVIGTAVLGIVLFGESLSFARLSCVALIVAGVAGLKFVSTGG